MPSEWSVAKKMGKNSHTLANALIFQLKHKNVRSTHDVAESCRRFTDVLMCVYVLAYVKLVTKVKVKVLPITGH